MEYLMIIALAMMIIIPGMTLYRDFFLGNSDDLTKTKISVISSKIEESISTLSLYGDSSSTILEIDMPSGIDSMFSLEIPSNNESYIVYKILTSFGIETEYYETSFPLKSVESISCNHEDCTSDKTCICFPTRYYSKGKKNLKLKISKRCDSLNPEPLKVDGTQIIYKRPGEKTCAYVSSV